MYELLEILWYVLFAIRYTKENFVMQRQDGAFKKSERGDGIIYHMSEP